MTKGDNTPRTYKILGRTITKGKYKNPKTKDVKKSKYIQYDDGRTKTVSVEKEGGLRGIFGRKTKTVIRSSASSNPEDKVITTKSRQKGIIPRVKTTTEDVLLGTKETKKSPLYDFNPRITKKGKIKTGIRTERSRSQGMVKNCIRGCQ